MKPEGLASMINEEREKETWPTSMCRQTIAIEIATLMEH